MSLINDFEKLHISTKTSFLTIFSQIPLFFISVYLFKIDLIQKIGNFPLSDMDFWFLASLCFGLSLTWFSANLILSFIIFTVGDELYNNEQDIEGIFKSCVLYSIIYLSFSILINYKINLGFYNYMLCVYGFILFRIIWVLIAYAICKKKQHRK